MFDWDDANIEHIARHGLGPEDVEEALSDPDGITAPAYNRSELRKGFIGATEAGRVLYVAYTLRSGRTRVVTARNAHPREKRRYRG